MYGDTIIRIRKLQNGFTVSMNDPAIVKKNRERDTSGKTPSVYRDPEVTYTFKDAAAVAKFVGENIDKVIPEDDFSSSFDKAAQECCDDDD